MIHKDEIVINESAQKMKAKIICYLAELEKCNIEKICQLFDKNADIYSPFLGWMKPRPFFEKLRDVSGPSKIIPIDIFLSSNDNLSVTAYFRYDWTLSDGSTAPFDCIDIFDFTTEMLIEKMVIVYDTHPIRETVGDKYSH
ncbi:hypothetical protein [Marinomonas algicola]|uniref:hypothetical protein n=1 Tax=Marinomonas algicola TaxID=2773454 RepID=UPI0019D63D30|nr:hypothetical protein [Marinomonas algicola]